MSSPLVLVPTRANDLLLKACADLTLLTPWAEEHPEAVLSARADEVVAIANPGEGPLGEDLLARLPQLQVISHFGVGYDTVDVGAAVQRGVVVTHTAGANDEEVADTALGLLLMTVRELGRAERHLREGRWAAEGHYPLTDLSLGGRTLGLLGIGHIGQAIARRAVACGMTVTYHARTERDVPYRYIADLHALAEQSDVLVVAAPGGPATHHLIDAQVLRALGPQGVLINIARGSLVDEDALITALEQGWIHGAGLDVFEDEPHVPAALLAQQSAVLLPHVGSASLPTRRRMAALGAANLQQWFTDRRVLTPVAEARGIATVATPAGS
jgi:lactate dehydrogenase-like 2-hydroxyacid dehydrogenase